MRRLFGTLTRWLLTGVAALLIASALVVGGFRLLIAQLPTYQEQLQAWVTDTLGVELRFARLDAHWGLRGPELTFHDVRVGSPGHAEPFLNAAHASVRIDPMALLTERQVRLTQLAFNDTRLVLTREADGQLRLQDALLVASDRSAWSLEMPPELEIAVHNSEVLFIDHGRDGVWSFTDVSGVLRQQADALWLSARALPPAELAARIEISAEAWRDAAARRNGSWRLRAELGGADVAAFARILPEFPELPTAGYGDVAAELTYADGALTQVAVDLALRDVEPAREVGDSAPDYQRLGVSAEWLALEHGWQLVVGDLVAQRGDQRWPRRARARIELERDGLGDVRALAVASEFVRIEDLIPFVPARILPAQMSAWLEKSPHGDLADIDVSISRDQHGWDYTIGGRFFNLGLSQPAVQAWPGFSGLSGEIRADARSGRLRLDSRDLEFDWPRLFREPLRVNELTGLLVWREGRDGVRVVSDNLVLANTDARTYSSLELTWPRDGSSPLLDLESTITDSSVPAVRRYLPVHMMSDGLVQWLDHALAAGRVTTADVSFVGPVAAFPFDEDEGQFRASVDVEDGVLAYLQGWPVAEALNGTIEFTNASFAAHGHGRVLGHESQSLHVAIDDMRDAVLQVGATSSGPLPDVLDFLRTAPAIARHLGPQFERVAVPAGTGAVELDLMLPLRDPDAFDLHGSLHMQDGQLAIDGFTAAATEVNGTLDFVNGVVTGSDIEAVLFDGPVVAKVESVTLPGYRARISLEGEIAAHSVIDALGMPPGEFFAGQTRWHGSLLLPVTDTVGGPPVRATVSSSLAGIAVRLPQPFAKTPAEPVGLRLDLVYVDQDRLELRGDLGATRRFALAHVNRGDGFEFDRGLLRFGGGWPELPDAPGLVIDGTPGAVRLDEWVALARDRGVPENLDSLLVAADLEFTDLQVFGQPLGQTRLRIGRLPTEWSVELDSTPVAGQVLVPYDLSARAPLVARMDRLSVILDGAADLLELDPRSLPGLSLRADELSVDKRRFGRVSAEIDAQIDGLRLRSFDATARSFVIEGSGGWVSGASDAGTQLAFQLRSSDVAATLDELGFPRFADGQAGEVSASVHWPGPPSGDWARHVSGDLSIRVDTGSLVDLQPGAGRVIGLMSITALPRRLALDFRDVLQRGLVFDQISGDFLIDDGNAYTHNLTLTGPAVEIGVAGRTGLRDHDYQQHAVVTAEPGKMLPTVGGLLGGPGVGAALLIFTQLFREPLKGLGRVSYCVSGSWEEPQVERIGAQQAEQARACAELPPDAVTPTAATAEFVMP